MAPSLRKGKARAEEHKGRVITSKKKTRTRTRLSQQEVINKYIADHPDFWDKTDSARDKIITDLEAAWDLPSDTESEPESYADVMSQPGSGTNTPVAGGSHLPTGGPAPTLADLTRVVLDLGVAVGHITTQLNTLAQQVTLATSTRPRAAKVAVARPKAWSGKGGSVEARHFLAAFANYAGNEGDTLNDWDIVSSRWLQNDERWIAAVLNLMEDEARTWALPYLELLAQGLLAFQGDYNQFVQAFLKRFTPLDTTEAARDALKALKQGKNSVVEYISRFDQYTGQTGWSDADHRTRFYDGLNEQLKDNLAISDRPITSLQELKTAAQVLDQRMRQREAEKKGRTHHTTSQAPSKDPNAMEVDASRQKEERNRRTYQSFMRGKCYGCGSPDHTKKDGKHERDICGHCKKVGHRSPVCFAKYMGKPIAAKATASQESPEASGSKEKATASATQNAPAKDSKGQADLLAKLMAQIKEQSAQIDALKASF